MNIRRFEPESDSQALYEFYHGEGYGEFFRRIPPNLQRKDIVGIEALTGSVFYTFLEQNVPIGFASVSNIDPYGLSCQLGIILHKSFQDKVLESTKYAFEATYEIVKFLFKRTTLRKVSMVFLANRGDIRQSLERGGFVQEGFFSESCHYDGKYQHEYQYSLTKKDFFEVYKCRS